LPWCRALLLFSPPGLPRSASMRLRRCVKVSLDASWPETDEYGGR
jgi:hypothetical protein